MMMWMVHGMITPGNRGDGKGGDEEGGEGGNKDREGRQEGGRGTVLTAIVGWACSKHFFSLFLLFPCS